MSQFPPGQRINLNEIINFQFEFETLEVESFGETAYLVAKYFVYGAGTEAIDVGKYIRILKSTGKDWKLHRDIWNSSLPAPE